MARLNLRDLNVVLWLLVGITVFGGFALMVWATQAGPVRQALSALTLQGPARDGTLDPQVLAAAERLNDARVWHTLARAAAAPSWSDLEPETGAKFAADWSARADKLAPRDPVIALDRALAATKQDTPPAEFLAAARRAAQVDPENAAAWYVLAAARGAQKDGAGVLAALARGNRAPRCDFGEAALYATRTRLARAARWPLPLVDLAASHIEPWDDFERRLDSAELLLRPADLATQVELLATAARVRETATSMHAAATAHNLYVISLRAHRKPATRGVTPKDDHNLELLLSEAGKAKQAAFVAAEAKRAKVFTAFIGDRSGGHPVARVRTPLVAVGGALIFWAVLAVLALVAAVWILLVATGHALVTSRQPRPDGWPAGNLALVWLFSLAPAILAAVWFVAEPLQRQLVQDFAWDAGVSLAIVTLPLWPLLVSLVAVAVTRQGRPEDRPGVRGLQMPTAALLLLLSAASVASGVVAVQRESAKMASFDGDQMVDRRHDLDAASRLPKVSWPAPR